MFLSLENTFKKAYSQTRALKVSRDTQNSQKKEDLGF